MEDSDDNSVTDTTTSDRTRRERDTTAEDDISMGQPPQQRIRVDVDNGVDFEMSNPRSNSASNRNSITRTEVVDLHVLTDDGAEPRMDHAIVLQFVRLITHNPNVQNGSNAQTYNRPRSYGPVRPSSMPYTRLFMCRVYSKTEGNLLVYLMESPALNKNTNLWRNNVELRDNGEITIGTIFRVTAPLPVTSYMRGDTPLIQTHQPAIILHSPSRFVQVSPHENLEGESSRAFVLNGGKLSCRAYSCEKTKCGGSFCDRKRLNEWNTPLGTCGCYSQRSRGTNNLTLLYPVMKLIHEGSTYNHKKILLILLQWDF